MSWAHYRSEYYSYRDALEAQYPSLIRIDKFLSTAITQIRIAEVAIDAYMNERQEQIDEGQLDDER